MGRIGLHVILALTFAGCGSLSGGEAIASLLPTSDLPVPATLTYPRSGTLDGSAFAMQAPVAGAVLDQYGAGMAGVVICHGLSGKDAVAIGVTDSGGAYSAMPPQSFSGTSGYMF
jgi:hypothetical protein